MLTPVGCGRMKTGKWMTDETGLILFIINVAAIKSAAISDSHTTPATAK